MSTSSQSSSDGSSQSSWSDAGADAEEAVQFRFQALQTQLVVLRGLPAPKLMLMNNALADGGDEVLGFDRQVVELAVRERAGLR